MILSPRLLFDFRGIEQGRDNCSGANTNRHAGLDQFVAAFVAGAFGIVTVVRHAPFSMGFSGNWKVA